MYRLASDADLTAEQVQELDDTYLASSPFNYFCARINMLLSWMESRPTSSTTEDVQRFRRYLGTPLAVDQSSGVVAKDSQIAADAFTLRHHVAEAMLRFAAALVARSSVRTDALWTTLASDMRNLVEVKVAVQNVLTGYWILDHAVQDLDRTDSTSFEDLQSAVDVFGHWITRAMEILTRTDLDTNAANNKFKHGLAVRSRADLKMTFTLTGPSADGTIPVSALTGPNASDIFDQPVLEFVSRPPKVDGVVQGWELTQLRLDPAALLAETYMLAWTHAALFSVAARRHFDGRAIPDHTELPAHPGFPVGGPYPNHIGQHDPIGMRWPITRPLHQEAEPRPPAIVFREGKLVTFTSISKLSSPVQVVDDPYWPQPPATDLRYGKGDLA